MDRETTSAGIGDQFINGQEGNTIRNGRHMPWKRGIIPMNKEALFP
jgi:hypothetical protein